MRNFYGGGQLVVCTNSKKGFKLNNYSHGQVGKSPLAFESPIHGYRSLYLIKNALASCLSFISTAIAIASLSAMSLAPARALTMNWTDWTSFTGSATGAGAFTGLGTITTPSTVLNVTYNNPAGIAFYQTGTVGDTDYWANSSRVRNAARSPYTGAIVSNIPTGKDMIALKYAGSQSLTFSKTVANPVFSYISLNGNGYAFDRDFAILSFGDGTVRDAGYWGPGTSSKQIVDIGGGVLEYRLVGTLEPHGTIQFLGSFDTVSWRSLSNENWNGFTVGVQGTAAEVFAPEPGVNALIASMTVVGAGFFSRRRLRRK